ncbi:unnamed protein product [Pleuronectes platessa]|uniref:Uncharacterized protein n=1 Tax=Pleuronectes platessa TaxID=8262 RepID=A0A9N7YKM8_PLEPL|nr:unnamed protein product [Pleuronectes platessa]
MPQWHVKECYVPAVPTLPVGGALCQAPPPTSRPVPCQGSGHCDRGQMPVMCLHRAACPLALIPGAALGLSCTLPRKMPGIAGGARQRMCPRMDLTVQTENKDWYTSACCGSTGREGGGGGGGGAEEREEKRRGGGEEGLDENKSEMKAFLEATKELYTGRGSGSPQWA